MEQGKLRVHVATARDTVPIGGARVITRDKMGRILFNQLTDQNGMTDYVTLDAPDASHTLDPNFDGLTYAVYDVEVTAQGFHPVIVHDVEIVARTASYLPVFMHPNLQGDTQNNLTRLYRRYTGDEPELGTDMGELPPNHPIAVPVGAAVFDPNQPIPIPTTMPSWITETAPAADPPPATGEAPVTRGQAIDDITVPPPAVLGVQQAGQLGGIDAPGPVRQVFIPTHITVHLGRPDNLSARNVRVPFVEYIANVASSEIFPTWPDASLRANIHAIVTFTLNRVYTEWYRSRGRNFDITNSTAFDQFYVHGRNIFENMMQIASEIFNQYVRRTGFRNPVFTSYCNGTTATCSGLSQWGTVTLANQGMTPLQIIRRYYGQDVNIDTTNLIQDIRTTYPGTAMRLGSQSRYVQLMQTYLNRIRQNYPLIPRIAREDGVFGPDTDAAVRQFQRTFGLGVDGVIGPTTWNRVTQLWVAVTRLADLNTEGERYTIGATPPNVVLRQTSSGNDVRQLQWLLNFIGEFYEFVPADFVINGTFGPITANTVREFQRNFGLNPDGVVGPATWNRLYEVYRSIRAANPLPGPQPPVGPPPVIPPPPPATGTGTVTTAGGTLNVRSGAGTNFPAIGSLPNGTTVTILGEQGNWFRIRFGSGEGWVSKDFVRTAATPTTGRVATQGGNLNFRSGPTATSPIIGVIPNGSTVEILGTSGNFFNIRFGGRTGFASRDFIRT